MTAVFDVVNVLGVPTIERVADLSIDGPSGKEASTDVLLLPVSSDVDNLTRGGNMIQKCANPECNAEFRYASRGHVFSFEIRHPTAPCRDVPQAICDKKPSHAMIHFWLCENCSPKLSLHFTMEAGLSVVAVPETVGLRGISESPEPSISPCVTLGQRSA